MVNTALSEDLESMQLNSSVKDAMQLKRTVIWVEDAKMAQYVGLSMLQWRQLSEILSEDGKWKWTVRIATT